VISAEKGEEREAKKKKRKEKLRKNVNHAIGKGKKEEISFAFLPDFKSKQR